MRITSWNILHGAQIRPQNSSQTSAPAGLAQLISDIAPDILGAQEVDYFLQRSARQNQIGEMAQGAGAAYWAFAPALIGDPDGKWRKLTSADPAVITGTSPLAEPGYGIGIVSKIPVISWHRMELKSAPFGLPMPFPSSQTGVGKIKWLYIKDHPRCALAAVLESGWLIINTHLSFLPIYSYLQLLKVKRWSRTLPISDKSKIIIMGDLNSPLAFLARGVGWNSLIKEKTFPSWGAKFQMDYILSQKIASEDIFPQPASFSGISDHLPLTIDIPF